MENASRALIIAGAVIAAIMVVGLGVFIFNKVRPTDTSALTTQEVMEFNESFRSYDDQKIYGREVKNLIQKVISSNQNNQDKKIDIELNGRVYTHNNPEKFFEIANKVLDNATYEIHMEFSAKGVINKIIII